MAKPATKKSESSPAFHCYTLKNRAGVVVQLSNYGATIISIQTPDRTGKIDNIVLTHARLEDYFNELNRPYFGATIGRYANRIRNARFRHQGKIYQLTANHGATCLHGGKLGFDRQLWHAKAITRKNASGIRFSLFSPDGQEGFPGNVNVTVSFILHENNTLSFEAAATTDKATPINLTTHSYFNLAGSKSKSVLKHQLWINADRYTPLDKTMLPTGILAPVKGLPLDFTQAKPVGRHIDSRHPQLSLAGGYDHNFVLNKTHNKKTLTLGATLFDPQTGRFMELWTQEPGLQLYTGNFLHKCSKGKPQSFYAKNAGLCLEPQHFPDSPNHAHFPNTILRPGSTYTTKTAFVFSTKNISKAQL